MAQRFEPQAQIVFVNLNKVIYFRIDSQGHYGSYAILNGCNIYAESMYWKYAEQTLY